MLERPDFKSLQPLVTVPPQTWTLCRLPHGRDLFYLQGAVTLAYFF